MYKRSQFSEAIHDHLRLNGLFESLEPGDLMYVFKSLNTVKSNRGFEAALVKV